MTIDRMIPFWSQLQTLRRWPLYMTTPCVQVIKHYPIGNHGSAAFPPKTYQRTNAVLSVLPRQPIGC